MQMIRRIQELIVKGLAPRSGAARFVKAEIIELLKTSHECSVILSNGVTIVVSSMQDGRELKDLLQY